MDSRDVCVAVSAAAMLTGGARAGLTFTDDFESYLPGTFPSANWFDAGKVAPSNKSVPDPSCLIGATTDAFGDPTQALHLDRSWLGASAGVYRFVDPVQFYTLSMDVRTDQFSDGSTDEPLDWPWAFAVGRSTDQVHVGAWGSLQMYGASLTEDFRGYAIAASGIEEDLPLDLGLSIGVWYHVQMDADAYAGSVRYRVWDVATNDLLLDATTFAAGWTPEDGVFDSVSITQGELTGLNSAEAWIDNVAITVIPGPAPAAALVLGASLAVCRRRRADV